MSGLQKIARIEGDAEVGFSHPPIYKVSTMGNDIGRIVAGVPADDTTVFQSLTTGMAAPYFLLYVLHTPRGEGEPGRYQSPALSAGDIEEFLTLFGDFLCADARFDLWSHSPNSGGTVVWDRHNLLYAYGDLTVYEDRLKSSGFVEGVPKIDFPHAHFYRDEFDARQRLCCSGVSGATSHCSLRMSNIWISLAHDPSHQLSSTSTRVGPTCGH